MKNFFCYFIYIFSCVIAHAQEKPGFQTQIEIEASKNSPFTIQPVGSEGLVLIKKDTEIKKTLDIRWTIVHLDKNFHKQSEVSSGIADYLKLSGVYYDSLTSNPKLYCFFSRTNKLKKELLIYDIHSHKIEKKVFEIPKKYPVYDFLSEFKVYKDIIYVTYLQSAFCLNVNTGKFTPISLEKDDTGFRNIHIKEKAQLVDLFAVHQKKKEFPSLKMYEFQEDKYQKTHEFTSTSPYLPFQLYIAKDSLNRENQLLYGKALFGSLFYFGASNTSNVVTWKSYNFSNFGLLDSSLIETRKSILNQKSIRIYGEYRMISRDLIWQDGQYIWIGEIYFPAYAYEAKVSKAPIALTVAPNTIGALYTHVFVAGLNSQGDILWNNFFKIGKNLSAVNTEYIYAKKQSDETIKLSFLVQNKPYTKIIRPGGIQDDNPNPIVELTQIDYDNEIIEQGTSPWYDNYFIQYNYKLAKNRNRSSPGMITYVLSLNKIAF